MPTGKYGEAISIMCKRCCNFDMCKGTGCEPKKTLERACEELEATNKVIEDWANMVDEIEENERRIAENEQIRRNNASL